MALQDPQAEPSMEEILASIRRIISEEEQPAAAEEILDLTPAQAAPAAPVEDDIVFEAEPVAAAPAPTPQPAPAPVVHHHVAAPVTHVEQIVDTIISPPAATVAASALSRLAGTLRIADTPGQTVEGVVRELLKPMLRDWLDQNLPAIVEARVEAELERIARLAR